MTVTHYGAKPLLPRQLPTVVVRERLGVSSPLYAHDKQTSSNPRPIYLLKSVFLWGGARQSRGGGAREMRSAQMWWSCQRTSQGRPQAWEPQTYLKLL